MYGMIFEQWLLPEEASTAVCKQATLRNTRTCFPASHSLTPSLVQEIHAAAALLALRKVTISPAAKRVSFASNVASQSQATNPRVAAGVGTSARGNTSGDSDSDEVTAAVPARKRARSVPLPLHSPTADTDSAHTEPMRRAVHLAAPQPMHAGTPPQPSTPRSRSGNLNGADGDASKRMASLPRGVRPALPPVRIPLPQSAATSSQSAPTPGGPMASDIMPTAPAAMVSPIGKWHRQRGMASHASEPVAAVPSTVLSPPSEHSGGTPFGAGGSFSPFESGEPQSLWK